MRSLALLLLCGGCCFKAVNVGGIGATTGTVFGTGTGGSTSGYAAGTSSGGSTSGASCNPFSPACPTGQYCDYTVTLCDGGLGVPSLGSCVTPSADGSCETLADCPAASAGCVNNRCQYLDCPFRPDAGAGSCPGGSEAIVPPHEGCNVNECLGRFCPFTTVLPVIDPWPQRGHDAQHTSRSTADTSHNTGAVAFALHVLTPGSPSQLEYGAGPAVAALPDSGYLVLQVSLDGQLIAVNPGGTVAWSELLTPPGTQPWAATPAVDPSGPVYVVSEDCPQDSRLSCRTGLATLTLDGEPAVTNPLYLFVSAPLLLEDGSLFVANATQQLTQVFEFQGAGDAGPSMIHVDGMPVPEDFASTQVSGVVGPDGESFWVGTYGSPGNLVFGFPSAADAGFLIPTLTSWPDGGVSVGDGGTITFFNVAENYPGSLYVYSAGELSGGLGCFEILTALSPATGETAWVHAQAQLWPPGLPPTVPCPASQGGPALGADGTVYVGMGDGLHALEGATGTEQWQFKSANVSAAPAIGGDGTIFFGCSDGVFYAVQPDGGLRFAIDAGATIGGSPAIAPDGTVVFVSDDGTLWGVR